MYSTSVLIGRFQPFHNGHLHLLTAAAALADKVVVVLGSAYSAAAAKNPFSVAQRIEMIKASVSEEIAVKLVFVPIRDYYDNATWVDAVKNAVGMHAGNGEVALVGHVKDTTSGYLNDFPSWFFNAVTPLEQLDATTIRSAMFERGEKGVLEVKDKLPAGAYNALIHYVRAGANYRNLKDEHEYILNYKKAWEAAPYRVNLVTVDSVIRYKDRVLLVSRKGLPGRGLLALPGGFLDANETALSAALRETQEETGVDIDLRPYLQGEKVFDHPYRSQLGRVITFSYYFDLSDMPAPPKAIAGDDAATVAWVPIEDLQSLSGALHDDHFNILQFYLS